MVFVGESEACNQICYMYNGLFDSMSESRAACIVMRLQVDAHTPLLFILIIKIYPFRYNAMHCGTIPLFLAQYHTENRTQWSYFHMILIQVWKGYIYAYILTLVHVQQRTLKKKMESYLNVFIFKYAHTYRCAQTR